MECFKTRPIQLTKPAINKNTGEKIYNVDVRCGNCINCIKTRRSQWSFRLTEELKVCKNALFVTLTYTNEHVPYDKYGNKILVHTTMDAKRNLMKINRKEIPDKYLKKMKLKEYGFEDISLQGFLKRLRKNQSTNKVLTPEKYYRGLTKDDKIKFFACGEYGSDKHTTRPHFHLILFNTEKSMIEKSWKYGSTCIVNANIQSIAYCTKYLDKWVDKKQDWKKPKEFGEMSNGIGESYMKKMASWHKKNLDINYAITSNGIKVPMPRVFRLKMLSEDEKQYQIYLINKAIKDEKENQICEMGLFNYQRRRKSEHNQITQIFKGQKRKEKL